MLEASQEARVESSTGKFGHIVTSYHVLEDKLNGPKFLQSNISKSKLAELSFSTGINIPISCQKTRVLKAAVDLDDLFVALKTDIYCLGYVHASISYPKSPIL